MLFVPSSDDFKYIHTNATARPAAAYGVTVTPGNNTYGAYASVLSATEHDCYGLMINVNSNAVSAASRDTLITVGRDLGGGTSFTDWLTDLLVTSAGPYNNNASGIWYYFPMFLRAGSSLGVKASVNNATVGTLRANLYAFGQPRRPESVRYATRFRSFGVVQASSRGTIVTPGTTNDGAWTQLGSATDAPLWWWQVGWGADDTTLSSVSYHADLSAGDASNKKIILSDLSLGLTTNEQVSNRLLQAGCVCNVAAGDLIYGRMQCSGTSDSNVSMAAYGCG